MSSTSLGIPLNTSLDGFSVTFNGQPGALFGVFGEDFGPGWVTRRRCCRNIKLCEALFRKLYGSHLPALLHSR